MASPSPATWFDAPPQLAVEPEALAETSPGTDADPGALMLTCANFGAAMDERKCKLICRCGYFLSCSDYY